MLCQRAVVPDAGRERGRDSRQEPAKGVFRTAGCLTQYTLWGQLGAGCSLWGVSNHVAHPLSWLLFFPRIFIFLLITIIILLLLLYFILDVKLF